MICREVQYQGRIQGKLLPENGWVPKITKKRLVKTWYVQSNWILKKSYRNKPNYRSANKSLFVQNFRLLFLAVFPTIVMELTLRN